MDYLDDLFQILVYDFLVNTIICYEKHTGDRIDNIAVHV